MFKLTEPVGGKNGILILVLLIPMLVLLLHSKPPDTDSETVDILPRRILEESLCLLRWVNCKPGQMAKYLEISVLFEEHNKMLILNIK